MVTCKPILLEFIAAAHLCLWTRSFALQLSVPQDHRISHSVSRWLREKECGPDFVRNPSRYEAEVLGPSSATDSLFKSITYPNGKIVDMTMLPIYSIFPLYIEPTDPTFIQNEQFIGRSGQHTKEIFEQHELLKGFWKTTDVGPPILLIGLHSEALADADLLSETVRSHYVAYKYDTELLTDEALADVVQQIQEAIEDELPGSYSNPALTPAAFFSYTFKVSGFQDAVIMVFGDGVWDWIEWNELSDVGNDIVHAHEFAHYNQFIMGLEDNNGDLEAYKKNSDYNTPEGSRRTELEADAMGAYALAHNQGRDFPLDLLLQASRATFARGSCDVDKAGHHGTPQQRECATLWGADEGFNMAGDPVSMREFRRSFLQNLDLILAVDPSVCKITTPNPSPKSPSDNPLCFSGLSEVVVEGKGVSRIANLSVGDAVLTSDGTFSTIYSFGHYDQNGMNVFLQIQALDMDENRLLEISADHLIYTQDKVTFSSSLVPAGNLKVGDWLLTQDGPMPILSINTVQRQGAFSPLTSSGNLLVNGVAASNYVTRPWLKSYVSGNTLHAFQHGAIQPVRFYCSCMGSACQQESYDETTGFSPWIKFWYGVEQWHLMLPKIWQVIFLVLLAIPVTVIILLGKTVLVAPTTGTMVAQIIAVVLGFLVWKKQQIPNVAEKIGKRS